MINKSKFHSSLSHHNYVQNPVTVLHLIQDAAGSSKSPSESVDNRRGRTAANPRPTNHPVLPWQGLQSKYEYQVKKMSTSLPEAQTHGAFITWKCNKIFLRLSYLCYIHKDHNAELQKNAVSTTASHWCSYSNLGFNRYQSKLPSKKSREALLIAHRNDNEELWGKKISNFS